MAAALVAGFVAAVIVLRANLISSSRDATTARAESVAALVTEGVVPDPLVAGEGVLVIEVVDPAGGLFATSLPNGDLVPYDRFATEGDETEGEPIRVSEQEVDFEIVVGFDVDGPVELTWLSVDVDGQPHEVRVYAALEFQSSVDAFVRVLVPGLPLVLRWSQPSSGGSPGGLFVLWRRCGPRPLPSAAPTSVAGSRFLEGATRSPGWRRL